MEFLQQLLSSSSFPALTALILGLMTAISPCPLATNITAISYIGKDIENKRLIFINSLLYTLGRAISYTALGVAIWAGASKFHIARFFQDYGERFLGPFLILVGILMLGFIKINFPGYGKLSEKISGIQNKSWMALLLGIIFALAFCPYSGVIYFGMLIPMTVASASGLYLPVIFAIATGLPVLIIAWLLAYSLSGIGNFYNRLKTIEKWLRYIVALVFIGVGLYYVTVFYIL